MALIDMNRKEGTNKQHNTDNQFMDTNKSGTNTQASISEEKRAFLLKKIAREAQSRLASYELPQEAALFRKYLEISAEKENVKIEEIDKHFLKGFLSYASRLYNTGEISEETYVSLVTQAAESYAERLVESKIAKSLEKYDLYLEKAGIRWFL